MGIGVTGHHGRTVTSRVITEHEQGGVHVIILGQLLVEIDAKG